MTYQPLARKYRPSHFRELVGQEAVAKALANAIAMGREPHALIFTGVRGVGKTTIARLYAKALNCESRQEGAEPCNACGSCLAIAKGNHEDVLEIDGASNTGVGDVRALQETVAYRPQRSAFKVYIIDEVHMLSQAAFNALLKTLEEPPAHVVFVFATTEIHKVPQTILSRCQAFYLKKLPTALILTRLRELLGREGVEAEDKAVAVVAREGHGSMRDALTLLDQAIALGHGKVTVASLGPVVSNLSSSPYLDLLAALVRRDAAGALATVAQLDQSGAEFDAVTEETAQMARHAFVAQGLGVKALDVALLGLDDTELQTLAKIAEAAAPFDLNRIFRTLMKCRTELDGSTLDRYVLENYLFEWCFDPGLPDVDALLAGDAAPRGAAAPAAMTSAAQMAPAAAGNLNAAPAEKAKERQTLSMRSVMDELKAAGKGGKAPASVAPSPAEAVREVPKAPPQEAKVTQPSREAPAAAPPPPAREAPKTAASPREAPPATSPLSRPASAAVPPTAARETPVAVPPASTWEASKPPAAPLREAPKAAPSPVRSAGPAPSGGAGPLARPGSGPSSDPPPVGAARPGAARSGANGPRAAAAPMTPLDRSGAAPSMPPDFDDVPLIGSVSPAVDAGSEPAARAGARLLQPLSQGSQDGSPGLPPDDFAPVPPPSAGAGASEAFPATWRQLVDGWKRLKPLQARKLEEAHPLAYGPDRIVIAVSEESYASKCLLQKEEQGRIREHFRELFGFTGTLLVQARTGAESSEGAAAPLPDTILAERGREQSVRREKLLEDARNAPFTRDLLAALGGTLEDVRIPNEIKPE